MAAVALRIGRVLAFLTLATMVFFATNPPTSNIGGQLAGAFLVFVFGMLANYSEDIPNA